MIAVAMAKMRRPKRLLAEISATGVNGRNAKICGTHTPGHQGTLTEAKICVTGRPLHFSKQPIALAMPLDSPHNSCLNLDCIARIVDRLVQRPASRKSRLRAVRLLGSFH